MKSANRTAAAIVASLFATTIGFVSPASAGTSWKCFDHKPSERRFTRKMNHARAQHGLGRVYLDKQASKVARVHSEQMAKAQAAFHSDPTKLGNKITRWRMLSENVGRGASVSSIHKAFMASSGHRANILRSNWKYVGIGTVSRNDVLYVTVVFESRRDPGTTLSPPRC